jgi:ABC-type transport system involved in multi-copper enzyme maturation permease subunit
MSAFLRTVRDRLGTKHAAGILLALVGVAALVASVHWLPLWQQAILWAMVGLAVTVAVRTGFLKLFGPVLFYDMVRSARRLRFVVVRTLYALFVSFILCWLFIILVMERGGWEQPAERMSTFATGFLYTFLSIQFITVFLLTPAYTAGAIAEEKERKTLEFILATDLLNQEVILGKVASRLLNLSLLLLAGIPILAFLQFLGGVDIVLVLAGFVATALTMFSLAGLSMLNSVLCRRARDAVVMTYLMAFAYLVLANGAWIVKLILRASRWWPEMLDFPSTTTWQSPVTISDLIDWFNAGNIAFAVYRLGSGSGATAVFEQELPAVLGGYAIFHLLAGLAALGWSVLRLRVLALREQVRRPARKKGAMGGISVGGVPRLILAGALGLVGGALGLVVGDALGLSVGLLVRLVSGLAGLFGGGALGFVASGALGRRPRVGRHPMIWKEVFAEGGLRLNSLGRIVAGVLVLAGFLPAIIILWNYFDHSFGSMSWRQVGEAMNAGQMRFVGTVVATLMLLAVVVRAASSIRSERERNTFDELLTTRLTNSEILFGKWAGAVLSVRWFWAWLGLIWVVSVVTGGVFILALPLILMAWLTYAAVGAGVGLWFSIGSKSSLRAIVASLATMIFLCGGHWLLTGLFCFIPLGVLGVRDPIEWMADLELGQTPPFVMGLFAYHGHEFETTLGMRDMVRWTICSLFGLGCWALLVPLLWVLVKRRFEQVTGRTPFLQPERLAPRPRRRPEPRRAVVLDAEPIANGQDGNEQILTVLPVDEKEIQEEGRPPA